MSGTVEEVQQQLSKLFGSSKTIPWDLYNPNDKAYLKKKVELLIADVEGSDSKTRRENEKLRDIRNAIVTAAWNQRKYNGGHLLMSIIYVACTETTEKLSDALNKTKFSIFPVLRIRKCRKINENSESCCMIFVDDNGRVYQNWNDYLDENSLPEGVLIAPRKGYYDFNENDEVILQLARTPASKFLSKAGNVANTSAGILGLGAGAVTIAAIALPVAAPVLIGAAVVGIGSGIVGAASSIARLVNRGKHEESINVTNSQARADWLGVAGGVVSLGATGATTALARYAATGRNVSTIARGAVNGLNIAAIAINGVGVGNSAVEMLLKIINDEEISSIDIVQLGASLFLVTHSVYNFRTASKIVNSSRDSKIQSVRKQLSNRQRKAFDRTYRETLRLKGATQGKMDVIRNLNNMPDSKQPLNDLNKINKQLNSNGLKASFHPDGRILLNNDLPVEASALRQNLQHGGGENIVANVARAPVVYPQENVNVLSSQSLQPSLMPSHETLSTVINLASIIGSTVLAAISDAGNFEDCVTNILKHVTKIALEKLLLIAGRFYSQWVQQIEQVLDRTIPLEEILWKTFKIVCEHCGFEDIEKYVECIAPEFIIEKLKEFYVALIPQCGPEKECSKCNGFYTIC